ncbi:helix-turn-helix domain-containing protein [Bacillus cereus]|nr:helix-turn-helix domain-containing protein [Bacillus cereus]
MTAYQFNSKEDLMRFIENEILTATEASELLGFSRSRFNKLVAEGRLKPAKKVKAASLFLKSDVEELGKGIDIKHRPKK